MKIDNSSLKLGDKVYVLSSFYSPYARDKHEEYIGTVVDITKSRVVVNLPQDDKNIPFPYRKTTIMHKDYKDFMGYTYYYLYESKEQREVIQAENKKATHDELVSSIKESATNIIGHINSDKLENSRLSVIDKEFKDILVGINNSLLDK